jgi:hypothetical protein
VARNEEWWHGKRQKGRALLTELTAIAERTRAAGFQTTACILDMAITELRKDVTDDRSTGDA